MSIKSELATIIKDAINKMGIDKEIIIDVPKSDKNGDYSCNVALTLSHELKKAPMDIAKEIVNNTNSDIIENIEVVNPGFINIFINKKRLLSQIDKIIASDRNYGKNKTGNGKKINVEYVSANPTGILHVGHGRGATYGDSLTRILSFSGYDVVREYYINDAGNQINNLAISIFERYKEICGEKGEIPEDGYHGKEIISIAQGIYDTYGKNKLKEKINFFKNEGLRVLINQIKKDLDRYRVNFDVFTSEQSLYDTGLVDTTLNNLKNSGNCFINDDALWLSTSKYGDEKDRVLIKSDGNYTYLLPDIAYHINKLDRGFDELIDVLGSDHHGYINRLKASLEILGKDKNKLFIKILQMVRLIKDNEEIKLSKRTGKTITLMELVDEVGLNATRYFFVSKSLDTPLDFDLDLAVKQSNENPVYYIEYANARITSILNNYKNNIDNKSTEFKTFNNNYIYSIIKKMSEFEDVIISAADKRMPHLIANYVYELASMFHTFYSMEKIITDDDEYTLERIKLLKAIKIVINNALDLLGIIPREEM